MRDDGDQVGYRNDNLSVPPTHPFTLSLLSFLSLEGSSTPQRVAALNALAELTRDRFDDLAFFNATFFPVVYPLITGSFARRLFVRSPL